MLLLFFLDYTALILRVELKFVDLLLVLRFQIIFIIILIKLLVKENNTNNRDNTNKNYNNNTDNTDKNYNNNNLKYYYCY